MKSPKLLHILFIAAAIVGVLGALSYRERLIRKSALQRYTAEVQQISATSEATINTLKQSLDAAKQELANLAAITPEVKVATSAQSLQDTTEQQGVTTKPLFITAYRKALAADRLPKFNAKDYVEVPFSNFLTKYGRAKLFFHAADLASALQINEHVRVLFPRSGVPLKLVEQENGNFSVFFRSFFDNKLWLYRFSATTLMNETQIKSSTDAEPILREAILYKGQLYVILYDNVRMVNEVFALDSEQQDSAITPEPVATLPTLEDPAGTHYEMMPSLFMLPQHDRLWIVGGTLITAIEGRERKIEHRLRGCIRAQEAVILESGPAILCLLRDHHKGRFELSRWGQHGQLGSSTPIQGDGVPYRLRNKDGEAQFDIASTTADASALLRYDLEMNHLSGVMEFGTNNIEGRVAWSQIYFLNGLLDILLAAQNDNDAFDRLLPLTFDAKRRLDIEVYILDRLVSSQVGYWTKAFTVRREPALFAVQTSRLLLLFDRYRREVANGAELQSYEKLREQVISLDGHIEEFRSDTTSAALETDRAYLAWPKGSAFFFDGLNVPYNHQNEWSYAVFETLRNTTGSSSYDRERRVLAAQIINRFLADVADAGEMPRTGEWPYWWGQAHQGWTEAEGASVNKPSYPGDKSTAFISFRSIDVMATLAAEHYSTRAASPRLIKSIVTLVSNGQVYPFVNASLFKRGERAVLNNVVASHYVRLTAPWDLQNAVWALLDLPMAPAPEDPNSRILNRAVTERIPNVAAAQPDQASAVDHFISYISVAIPHNVRLAQLHQGLELGGKVLAWNLGYDLDAAVAAYERTHDSRLAQWIEQGLDAAFAMRDDKVGRRDDIRNRVMPAWGSNRYSPGKNQWTAWDAFTGAIIYPAIVYADLLRNQQTTSEAAAKADKYVTESIFALDSFDDWWRQDVETGAGWYLDPLYEDVAPLNHMNLLGLAHIELCARFSRSASCEKAAGLARFFKMQLKRTPDNTCEWEYWAGALNPKNRSKSGEDITHAHINVRFAHSAWQNGIVIERGDIECIAETFNRRVIRPAGDWAASVDGKGDLVGSGLHEGLSAWGILEDVAPGITQKIDSFMLRRPEAYPLGLLSYATGPGSFARRLRSHSAH